MEKVINYLTGFFGGLMAVMMAIIPVTILWYVLTGGDVWGMDVVTNLTGLVNTFGTGGFTGLVVLIMLIVIIIIPRFWFIPVPVHIDSVSSGSVWFWVRAHLPGSKEKS